MAHEREPWFHDEHGNLVVVQAPNLPILVWLGVVVLRTVVHGGAPERLADAVGFGALFTWAYLEVAQGSARIRRILGAVVLVAMVVGRVRG